MEKQFILYKSHTEYGEDSATTVFENVVHFARCGEYINSPQAPVRIDLSVYIEETGQSKDFYDVDYGFLSDEELEDFLGFELTEEEQRAIGEELEIDD